MKKILLCTLSIVFVITIHAQSQPVLEMSNAVTELVGSFMDNPYHHSNTLKIYDLTIQAREVIDEMYRHEYSKDNFKMVLAKNILPKKDIGDFNAVAYSCNSWDSKMKRIAYGTRRIVFGGDYQFVTFGDDENKYRKITKVASKRGASFDGLK